MDEEQKALFRDIVDSSIAKGDEPGFQFKLECPSCHDRWTTDFVAFSKGGGGGLFFKSGGGTPIDQTPEWNTEKREAFQKAVTLFGDNLYYCENCNKHVCHKCWNTVRNICLPCCATSAAIAMAQGLREEEDRRNAALNATCGKCGKKVAGFKFCPGCGTPVAQKGQCSNCSARVPTDAAFCPECGKKQ